MKTRLDMFLWVAVLGCFLTIAGCGGPDPMEARPDIAATSLEDHFGGSVKSQLYEFRAKVKKRGAPAAKQDLPLVIENVASYEQRSVGDKAPVYKEIVDKLKAMESSLPSASKDSLTKAAEEIGKLADKLPGKANSNPQVD